MSAHTIALVFNDEQEVFQQFGQELLIALHQLNHQTVSIHPRKVTSDYGDAQYIIAAGSEALSATLQHGPKIPVWSVLISKNAFEEISKNHPSHKIDLQAIYHDPPALRQMLLAKALLPSLTTVGYLYRSQNDAEQIMVSQAAKDTGLNIYALPIGSTADLPSALISVLQKSDTLLANADPLIYNSQTLKTILTAAYRHDKTLIGSTPAFVKAGSLATTYARSADIIDEIRLWAKTIIADKNTSLPPSHYPYEFDVMIKTDVARSLGIPAPNTEELKQKIKRQEKEIRKRREGAS